MVWCWCLENLNRYWICDRCVSISIRCGNSSPLSTITNSSRTSRFRSVDLDTPYVDSCHHHVYSTKVELCENKSSARTQYSRLQPNFHLKDSANDNSGFLVCSVAPRELSHWRDMHDLGLYLGSNGTLYIGLRHREHPFCLFFALFRVVYFGASMHLHSKKRTHNNLKSPNICPVRFEGMLIMNIPKYPSFFYTSGDRGGGNATSIEEKKLNWGVWHNRH